MYWISAKMLFLADVGEYSFANAAQTHDTMSEAYVTMGAWALNWNLKNIPGSNSDSNDPIRSQICACDAFVTCTKLCTD